MRIDRKFLPRLRELSQMTGLSERAIVEMALTQALRNPRFAVGLKLVGESSMPPAAEESG